MIRPAWWFLGLLAQLVQADLFLVAAVVAINNQVIVIDAVGRKQPNHRPGGEPVFVDDLLEHGLGIIKQGLGVFADHFIGEDSRIATRQLPGHEEGSPVDIFGNLG